jgi:hypothetical protein
MSVWLRRRLSIWMVAGCLPLFAQEFRAGITGIVKDTQGAVMPGVPVEAQNLATNDISRTTTNETGYYAFPVLPIGTYRVTAAPAGFKKAVRNNLELRVGDQVQQDFTVEIGAVTEQITVSAGAELLQTLASEKGQVIGEESVRDIPSVARNPFLLGIAATGVQFDVGAGPISRAARPFDAGNNVAESMSINGGRTGSSTCCWTVSPTPAWKPVPARPIWHSSHHRTPSNSSASPATTTTRNTDAPRAAPCRSASRPAPTSIMEPSTGTTRTPSPAPTSSTSTGQDSSVLPTTRTTPESNWTAQW